MKILVVTDTGTTYRIDPKMQFFERLEGSPETQLKRTACGFYSALDWETRPTGLHLALTCEATKQGNQGFHFNSSPVRKIEAA